MDQSTQKLRSRSSTPLDLDELVGQRESELEIGSNTTRKRKSQPVEKAKKQPKKLRRRASITLNSSPSTCTGSDGTTNTEVDHGLINIDAHPSFETQPLYESLSVAKEAIKAYGYERGVEWVFHQYRYHNNCCFYYRVRCRRFGSHRDTRKVDATEVRMRNGFTRKNGCKAQFILTAVDKNNTNGAWVARPGTVNGRSQQHNHRPAAEIGTLSNARSAQMTPDVKEALVQHYSLNMTPQESACALRQQDPKSLVNYRDIENFRQKNRLYTIGIEGKVTATLDYLKSNGYWHKYHVNPETLELLHLVWFHPQSLETFRKCPDAVLFGCAFKTNQYNIPMINFVAPTGNNSTLHIGCGLLTGATQQVYEWALNALKECLIEYNLLHELRLVVLDRGQACINAVKKTLQNDPDDRDDDNANVPTYNNPDVEAVAERTAIQIEQPDPENLPRDGHVDFIEPATPDKDPAIMAARGVFDGVDVLLCRWHINKDVMSYARTRCRSLGRREVLIDKEIIDGKTYKKGAVVDTNNTIRFKALYYKLLDSATEEEFEKYCKDVKALSGTMAAYLDRIWWPYKEMIIRCWTCKFTTWGITATSIVEVTHGRVKRWLRNGKKDVYRLIESLHGYFQLQEEMLNVRDVVKTTEKLPIALIQNELFEDLLGKVYNYAIKSLEMNFTLAKEQLAKRQEDPTYKVPSCKGMYSREWGWPCYHDCIKLLDASNRIENVCVRLDAFDKHWLVNRDAKGDTHERRVKGPAKVRQARLKEMSLEKRSKLSTEPRGLTGPEELTELQPNSMDARASQSTNSPRGDAPGQNTFVQERAASTDPIPSSASAHISQRQSIAPQASSQQYHQLVPAPCTQQQQPHSNASVIHNHYTIVNGHQPNHPQHGCYQTVPPPTPFPYNPLLSQQCNPQYDPPPSHQQPQYNPSISQQFNQLPSQPQPHYAYAASPSMASSQPQNYAQQQPPSTFINATYGNAGIYQPASAPHRP